MNYLEYYTDILEKVLTLEQMKLIFLMTLQDFFDHRIEINYLSSIASRFYYDLNKPNSFDSNNELQKFGSALDDAEEIDYYEENKKLLEVIDKK